MTSRLYFNERDEKGQSSHSFVLEGDQIITIDESIPKTQGAPRLSGLHTLMDIFLPSGFPNSVTPDYIPYQIFDSLQAFSSSIAGLLSSRAVLEGASPSQLAITPLLERRLIGFGVGNENASSTNAVLLSIFQDATGRLATILFAWKYGTALEPEAKMYRLGADVFNDSAFILDCLSPALPPYARAFALCLSGALRAVCGVCGGGAKAALSVHFARAGNVGELNAKDSSQETVIGLLGMLCGSFVMSLVTSRKATWMMLLLLLTIHLGTNYLAVRSVVLLTLSRQRANILYSYYRAKGGVLTPFQASCRERIFERSGVLRDVDSGASLGTARVCSSFGEFVRLSGIHLDNKRRSMDANADVNARSIAQMFGILQNERYLLCPCPDLSNSRHHMIFICFKEGAGPEDHLKAWLHAYELVALYVQNPGTYLNKETPIGDAQVLHDSLRAIEEIFPSFVAGLKAKGWDMTVGSILTRPVRSVQPVTEDCRQSSSEKFTH